MFFFSSGNMDYEETFVIKTTVVYVAYHRGPGAHASGDRYAFRRRVAFVFAEGGDATRKCTTAYDRTSSTTSSYFGVIHGPMRRPRSTRSCGRRIWNVGTRTLAHHRSRPTLTMGGSSSEKKKTFRLHAIIHGCLHRGVDVAVDRATRRRL